MNTRRLHTRRLKPFIMDIAYSYHDASTAFVPIHSSVSRGFAVYGLEMRFHRRRPGRLVDAAFCYIDPAAFRGEYGHVRLDACHPHHKACCTILQQAAVAKTTPASLAAVYREFLRTLDATDTQ